MSGFRYRLIVVTDGREGVLDQTLAAYDKLARPRPTEVVVVDDSGDRNYRGFLESTLPDWFPDGVTLVSHTHRLGFCETVADAWAKAAEPGVDWIVYLEDDFVLTRPVDWRDLAHTLEHEPQVAQMALYRNPVSAAEKAAGGYVALHPDSYTRRGSGNVRWLETTRCWTTNVSLFPRSIPATYAWPIVEQCEGVFGFQIRDERPGTTFGVWSWCDRPWTTHIGERSGYGY